MKAFIASVLTSCVLLCCAAIHGDGRAKPAADYPGCEKIFNGENFDGWEADPSTWSVVERAMRGVGGTSRLAYTKADYGSFRLIFTARMDPVNRDHLGVLFWGDSPDRQCPAEN